MEYVYENQPFKASLRRVNDQINTYFDGDIEAASEYVKQSYSGKRIGVYSGLYYPVNGDGYGGLEDVVAVKVKNFEKLDLDLTVFAPGDSKLKNFVPTIEQSLWLQPKIMALKKSNPEKCKELEDKAADNAMKIVLGSGKFDVLYSHVPRFAVDKRLENIFTIGIHHNPTDSMQAQAFFDKYPNLPSGFVSESSMSFAHQVLYKQVLYNNVDANDFKFSDHAGTYDGKEFALIVGRIAYEKAQHEAIAATASINKRLKEQRKPQIMLMVMGRPALTKAELAYQTNVFEKMVKENSKFVVYVGEQPKKVRDAAFRKAKFIFMPSSYPLQNGNVGVPEPFGLPPIQAGSSGTPTLAYNYGALREIVQNGVNGWRCTTHEEFVERGLHILSMHDKKYEELRRSTREFVETNFSGRIAINYLIGAELLRDGRDSKLKQQKPKIRVST